jgi:hypothetical protein
MQLVRARTKIPRFARDDSTNVEGINVDSR